MLVRHMSKAFSNMLRIFLFIFVIDKVCSTYIFRSSRQNTFVFVKHYFSIDRCSRERAMSTLAIASSMGLHYFRLAPTEVAAAATVSGGNSLP